MKPRIRKLNIDEDREALEQHIDNYNAKIILDELQSNKENEEVLYEAYGIFVSYNTLIGFCGLSRYQDNDGFEYWDDNSKAISELWIQEDYTDEYHECKMDLYGDLLQFILADESNQDSNIFFDNNINISQEMSDQLGFITIEDGCLVRLSEKYKEENNL